MILEYTGVFERLSNCLDDRRRSGEMEPECFTVCADLTDMSFLYLLRKYDAEEQ